MELRIIVAGQIGYYGPTYIIESVITMPSAPRYAVCGLCGFPHGIGGTPPKGFVREQKKTTADLLEKEGRTKRKTHAGSKPTRYFVEGAESRRIYGQRKSGAEKATGTSPDRRSDRLRGRSGSRKSDRSVVFFAFERFSMISGSVRATNRAPGRSLSRVWRPAWVRRPPGTAFRRCRRSTLRVPCLWAEFRGVAAEISG